MRFSSASAFLYASAMHLVMSAWVPAFSHWAKRDGENRIAETIKKNMGRHFTFIILP
jgi:hypothetical protein